MICEAVGAVRSLNLYEAWQAWFSGEEVKSCALWGVKILWLGRVGKLLSFFSAWVILLDIFKEAGVEIFGKNLKVLPEILAAINRTFFNKVFVLLVEIDLKASGLSKLDNVDVLRMRNRQHWLDVYDGRDELFGDDGFLPGRKMNIVIFLLYILGFAFLYGYYLIWFAMINNHIKLVLVLFGMVIALLASFIMGGFAVIYVIPKLIDILSRLMRRALVAFGSGAIPVSSALLHPQFFRRTRVFSFLLLLVGFHFDYLAS